MYLESENYELIQIGEDDNYILKDKTVKKNELEVFKSDFNELAELFKKADKEVRKNKNK